MLAPRSKSGMLLKNSSSSARVAGNVGRLDPLQHGQRATGGSHERGGVVKLFFGGVRQFRGSLSQSAHAGASYSTPSDGRPRQRFPVARVRDPRVPVGFVPATAFGWLWRLVLGCGFGAGDGAGFRAPAGRQPNGFATAVAPQLETARRPTTRAARPVGRVSTRGPAPRTPGIAGERGRTPRVCLLDENSPAVGRDDSPRRGPTAATDRQTICRSESALSRSLPVCRPGG